MTHPTSSASWLLRAFAVLLGVGCHDGLPIPQPNRVPIAVARVAGQDGSNVSIDYNGMPVMVTLDGSDSSDPDGKVVTYRWLSGTAAKPTSSSAGTGGSAGDAGASETAGSSAAISGSGRWVPAGESSDWPPDEAMTTVTLDQGVYTFVLWVIDNRGAVSDPSTVQITISAPLDPDVKTCVDSAYSGASRNCAICVCQESDMCRMAAAESTCGADCWGLLNCIATMCPDYVPGGDTSCLGSKCASYLSGATGATAIGGCIQPACTAQCAP